ncbi:MAG: group 1 truncated hemoglobin [Rhizobacter sp.]
MKHLLRFVAVALMITASLHASAQTRTDDSLYQQLGGQPGLTKLMDDFMNRLLADKRMNPFFKDVDHKHVKAQLVAQFCEVSGGPCKLKGPDMQKAHAGMDITKRDFNALVEVLQDSMKAQGIDFSTQNQLLARLAPMHRDIINTP